MSVPGRLLAESQSCDPKTLQNARRAIRGKDLTLAERLALELVDCQGSLGDQASALLETIRKRRQNTEHWSQAWIAAEKGNFQTACDLLMQIEQSDPNFPDLASAKRRARCDSVRLRIEKEYASAQDLFKEGSLAESKRILDGIMEVDPDFEDAQQLLSEIDQALGRQKLARGYEDAQESIREAKWSRALRQLEAIQRLDGNYRDVRDLLRQVNRKISEASGKREFESRYQFALKRFRDGNLREARQAVEQALRIDGSHREARLLKDRIEERSIRERDTLETALTAFSAGGYEQCEKTLREFIKEPRSDRFMALSYFYLGASILSQSLLDGVEDEEPLRIAKQFFGKAKQVDPYFEPIWDTISPKVREVFVQASDDDGSN